MTGERYGEPEAGKSCWRIDPAKSRISFEARWLFGARTAEGVFERFDGWALLRADGSLVGELTIDASSVNTGIRLRDHHLQNKFFLDSANYPVITFTPSDMTISSRSVTGVGQLLVRDRSVNLPTRGTVQIDPDHITVSGGATLDVRQFGWPTALGYIGRSIVVKGAISLERYG